MSILILIIFLLFGAFLVPTSETIISESCLNAPSPVAEVAAVEETAVVEVEGDPDTATSPADDETLAAIEDVLVLADHCASVGDFSGLQSLYSPDAIESGAFDGEPVPVESGRAPEATATAGGWSKWAPVEVLRGSWVDPEHVVVQYVRGTSIREVRMVLIDGRWLINSTETVIDETIEDGMGTPDASGVLPVEVMQAIADVLVADDSDGNTASFTILSAEAVDWPDTFLGCPIEDAFAAQVITPGYLVHVEYQGEEYEVHTDLTGHAVTC